MSFASVRDKMAASRLKGKWVGGSVPMGYKVKNKHLVVVPAEAEIVRQIFQRYIEIQSPELIAMELNERGEKTKQAESGTRLTFTVFLKITPASAR